MEILNSIPLFTVRDREQARQVPAPRSMYGTGSSVFPTSQKEMQAETRQAHRRTMEARLRREPEDIRIQARKTAAIRILPALHREAHILPMEMLPETETIQAAAIPPVEAAIQMAAMVLRMAEPRKTVLTRQMPLHRMEWIGSVGNQMYQQQGRNAQYGQAPPQGGFAGDGFTNIPEGMVSQLATVSLQHFQKGKHHSLAEILS